MATSKKKSDKKYDGKDQMPWIVKDTSGKNIAKNESHDSFSNANAAAKRYTEATGIFAAAVRA